MARRSTLYKHEPKEWFYCPIRGCHRKFRSLAGRTKHIHIKHSDDNDLELQTSTSSRILPFDRVDTTSLPIDLDQSQCFDTTSTNDVPRTPSQSPLSPPPFHQSSPPPFQPEVEIHHDDAEQVPMSSTIYHQFINGMAS